MLLGGALSLLVALLVLAVAAIAILAVWLLLGRRDETPLRNPYTAYLGIVLFLSFLVALVAVRGLTASIAGAIADQPLDHCVEAVYEEGESVRGSGWTSFTVPEPLQRVPGPSRREFEPEPPEEFLENLPPDVRQRFEDLGRVGVPRSDSAGSLPGQAPQVIPPPPVPERPQVDEIRSACKGAGGRDRAASQAAESGTALIVALGIMLFHARAGKRLLDEERRDA